MPKSLPLAKPEEDYSFGENRNDFMCNRCGGNFPKPILATVLSNDYPNTYYACPRCLTKVSVVKARKGEEGRKTSMLTKEGQKTSAKVEDAVKCNHFLGYLKKRPKDMSIPDECLTCDRMIECLVR